MCVDNKRFATQEIFHLLRPEFVDLSLNATSKVDQAIEQDGNDEVAGLGSRVTST